MGGRSGLSIKPQCREATGVSPSQLYVKSGGHKPNRSDVRLANKLNGRPVNKEKTSVAILVAVVALAVFIGVLSKI